MLEYEGTTRQSRKRCGSCYKKMYAEVKEARSKAKRVITFCDDCRGKPKLCLPCFNEIHK